MKCVLGVVVDMDRVRTANLPPAQLAQIDALCEAMDREMIAARHSTAPGRIFLDDWRDLMIQQALDGQPLPERWCRDEENAVIEQRFVKYGTREWRKALPWLVEKMRANGFCV